MNGSYFYIRLVKVTSVLISNHRAKGSNIMAKLDYSQQSPKIALFNGPLSDSQQISIN